MKLSTILLSSLSLLLIGCGGGGSNNPVNQESEVRNNTSTHAPLVVMTSELNNDIGYFDLNITTDANVPNKDWLAALKIFKRQTDPTKKFQEANLGVGWSLNTVANDPRLWTNIRCNPSLYAGDVVRFSCAPTDAALSGVAPQNLELNATIHETVVAYYSFTSLDPNITNTYTDNGQGGTIVHELFTIKIEP